MFGNRACIRVAPHDPARLPRQYCGCRSPFGPFSIMFPSFARETWHVRIHRETVKHLPIEIPPKAAKRFAWNFFPPSGLPRGRFTVKSGEAACRLRNAEVCASVAAAASRASSHRRNKFAPGAPSFEEKRERQGMYDPFLFKPGRTQLVKLTSCWRLLARCSFATSRPRTGPSPDLERDRWRPCDRLK